MGASSGYPMRIGPIWMDDVWCEGHETSLEQCSFNGYGVRYCDNMEAAGVFCSVRKKGTQVLFKEEMPF